MEQNKSVQNLPNLLTEQYFSNGFFYEKGTMADWIWNKASEKEESEVVIDILKATVKPSTIAIKPIVIQLPKLKNTILTRLKNGGMPSDFISEATFQIQLYEKTNTLKCIAILTDTNGKRYLGDKQSFHPHNNDPKWFKIHSKNDMDWLNEAGNQLNTSEWFGAIIRYGLHFGKRKFNTFYNQKELKKNAIVGYIFQISLLILFFYFLYKLSSSS